MRFKFVPEATTAEIFYLVIVLCVHETDVKVIKFPPRTIKFVCAHPENFVHPHKAGGHGESEQRCGNKANSLG